VREPPDIPIERLRACLREHYDLAALTLEFLPRGHDYSAGVYQVMSERGAAYLLKVTSRPLYEPSCLVPRYLSQQGIAAVVAPVPTTSRALWTTLASERGEWTAIVYPWITGDTSLTGMTDAQWNEAGALFKRIHQVRLSPEALAGFAPPRAETFDPTAYARWVRAFASQHLHARLGESESGSARAVRATWIEHQSTIHTIVTSLETLAAVLRSRIHALPYVICHADLHPANLLRDPAGHVFVIDWDEVMLAPKERDFIFIREPRAGAFGEGYGLSPEEIDWVALTYFRWERVVQDLIEDAQLVCFRTDVGEDTKVAAAQTIANTFAPSDNVAAAYAAAAHLPPDLSRPTTAGS
jgi:spectinomycin phosphotransferase